MFKRFIKSAKLILSNSTLLRRIGITFAILLVFKIGTFITVPLIDTLQIKLAIGQLNEGGLLGLLNTFSGGGLSSFSILALGISPYITASIVVQMLQLVIPPLKEIAEEGETGKQKLNRITRYVSVGLAFVQALALILGLNTTAQNILDIFVIKDNSLVPLFFIYMALVITAGSCFTVWIADLITQYGVGNGSSMIIGAGIITQIPVMIGTLTTKYLDESVVNAANVFNFVLILLLYVLIILGVVFLEATNRKIPVQYANRSGKSDSNIPIKLNTSGVMPVIFASTIMSLPLTVIGLLGESTTSGVGFWINEIFNSNQPIGMILYVILIYLFSFFYAFMQLDPAKVADNLKNSNAFIPAVRPGQETENYISRVLFKVTLLGATYLALLALIPSIVSKIFAFTDQEASVITIGGTGLLIIVGVAIETMKQLEAQATEQTYSGFIE